MPDTMSDEVLDFYRRPTPMTTLDHEGGLGALAGTGGDPRGLAEVVRGLLVHRDWAPLLGLRFGPDRPADQQIRPVSEMIERILELSPEPLSVPRDPGDRMVGVCRHFALLHVALLRAAGVPARARAGFGGYFETGWVDHWITEHWDGTRWVRHDSQIGAEASRVLGLDFDPADQPPGKFLTGAEAWVRCRRGEEDPDSFGIFDMRGLYFVLGDLLLDLAALNKVELLPWDGLGAGPEWRPDPVELGEIDRLAEVACSDDLGEIMRLYGQRRVPADITSFIDGVPTPVHLGSLVAAEVLGA
ncbi:MAG TPA: transglutaminase domain-containing protein [Acidimicrobiales bacterium]|nr:transglutaminase domain-containing protein [Acidimicrobiales bacterium]